MASGKVRQLRLHAIHQAQLVWSEMHGNALQQFIDSGVLESGGGTNALPSNPLADRIAADITANGGKLKVDERKFKRMLDEVTHGKP